MSTNIGAGPRPTTRQPAPQSPQTTTPAPATGATTQTRGAGQAAPAPATRASLPATATPASSRPQPTAESRQGAQAQAANNPAAAQLRTRADGATGRTLPADMGLRGLPASVRGTSTEAASSSGRTGGTGALGLADPNVPVAEALARSTDSARIDWDHPAAALQNMSQIDGNSHDGNDAVRCGATTLLAGSVARGREGFAHDMHALAARGDALTTRYAAVTTADTAGGPEALSAAQRTGLTGTVRTATATITRYADHPPETNAQMRELQEAVYTVGILDQRLDANGRYQYRTTAEGNEDPYLSTGTMRTYRDLTWGSDRPVIDGARQDVAWVSNEAGGGHFILADETAREGSRGVGFNPWPDSDGTAFARGTGGDAAGARVVPMTGTAATGRVRGIDVDDDATSRILPSR